MPRTRNGLSAKGKTVKSEDHLSALIERHAGVGNAVRGGIDETADAGDADTADLLTAFSRDHQAHGQHHGPPAPDETTRPVAHSHPARHLHDGEPAGYDRHAGHSVAVFRDKFWLSLALTVPTVVWGHMLPAATGFMAPT